MIVFTAAGVFQTRRDQQQGGYLVVWPSRTRAFCWRCRRRLSAAHDGIRRNGRPCKRGNDDSEADTCSHQMFAVGARAVRSLLRAGPGKATVREGATRNA